LAPASVADCGLFNPQAVNKLHDKCRRQGISGFRDNAAFIGILSSQLWCHMFAAGGTIRASNAA
jgi:asparagine synthase (glutamine-hydrolysing)